MGRIGWPETARTQITAEEGTEAPREIAGEIEAQGGYLLGIQSPCAPAYAQSHERSLHKPALSAETSCSVHPDGSVQRLPGKLDAPAFAQADEHRSRAVPVFVEVEFVDAL